MNFGQHVNTAAHFSSLSAYIYVIFSDSCTSAVNDYLKWLIIQYSQYLFTSKY